MRLYAANDIDHDSSSALPNLPDLKETQAVSTQIAVSTVDKTAEQAPSLSESLHPFQEYCNQLIARSTLRRNSTGTTDKFSRLRRILRQVLPGPYYPSNLREADKVSLGKYLKRLPSLDATIKTSITTNSKAGPDNTVPGGRQQPRGKSDTNSNSPTFLSSSQKIYDAEVTRRESINARCTTVLSTAGILGALFVAAGTLGLNLRSGPVNNFTWAILVLFLIALVYLGYGITVALQVQGDIQGEVIDWNNLDVSDPKKPLDAYNFNVALWLLTYANLNWCLNNNFKHRLHSAGRALRNGVVAIILAGALSPWAVTPNTSTTSTPPATHLVGSQAVAAGSPRQRA